MKVLIVDDRDEDRRILRYNLEHHGLQVVEAVNGVDALEKIADGQIELVISDGLMPIMDGFTLLRRMKNDPQLRAIPFIFYSCIYTGHDEGNLALALGAEAFLVKPLAPQDFWEKLKAIIHDLGKTPANGHSPLKESHEIFLEKYSVIVATRLEEKVRELEAVRDKWTRTFQALGDILTLMDRDMRILQGNEAACQFFKITSEEMVGKLCYELFRDTSSGPCQGCPFSAALLDGKPHSAIITHERLGKIFHVTCSPVLDEHNNVEYFVYVAKDITEQKKLEEELFQAHKMEAMGTMAGGIAHDFNNILSAIIGYTELAKIDILRGGGKPVDDLDQVIASGKRAADLVRQILSFSRKSPQQVVAAITPHIIVKEALKMLRASLPATIEINDDIDSHSGTIMADPTTLHQIVVNLCTNAFHAMENEKGILTIRLLPKTLTTGDVQLESGVTPGPFVELMVRDTGTGMDKVTLARIFEPYFTTKDIGKGTGLGLALVYGIVKNLNGLIRVQSEVGKGTTFRVYFPAIREKQAEEAPRQPESLPTGTERILFVDDEPTIVNLQKKFLEILGYTVTGMGDSEDALALFKEDPNAFDLLITDQTIPHLSGAELAREVLKLRADMPIILCTGYSSVLSEQQALEIGIRKYLLKPVDKGDLARSVRGVLDEKG